MSRKNPPQRPELLSSFDDEPTQMTVEPEFDDTEFPLEEDLGYDDPDLLFPEEEDERTLPGLPLSHDSFEDSGLHRRPVVLDPSNQAPSWFHTRAAPEVSLGPWKERAFIPRGVIHKEQLVAGMEQALQIAALQRGPVDKVKVALRAELLPMVRQAMEQAGGDGIDAWLGKVVSPPGRPAKDPLLSQLAQHMLRFGQAAHTPAVLAEARALCDTVKKALWAPSPNKLSLRALEEQFDGRLEVDTVLAIAFCSNQELQVRGEQVDRTLDGMRAQMRGSSGGSSGGLMWNFSRLKVEKRVIEAEQKRRGPARR